MWGVHAGQWSGGFCSWGPSFDQGPWFLGWDFPILFWGVIAFIIVHRIKDLFSARQTNNHDNALNILKNRFASGEINEQEYNSQKSILCSTQ
ncbi:SHOCT domain-containing protein [Desulfopila aestuarii]|uniref:SHOCT domain-containing protein n=1 Tax=Desulfopila aestuarii TaxID=231440 RepID=UPI0009359FBA